MTSKKLDIGIIGLGGAGRAHVSRFRRNQSVRRILGYDIRPGAVAEAGCEEAGSLDDLLSQVDAVSICTPDHLHLEGIVAALRAGRHVLVEKPMVASHAETLELEAVLREFPHLVFAVHHQMRHAPAFERASDLLASGEIGRPFYIEANYWHNMVDRSTMFDDWRMTHGQSLIFGHACHPLDLIMHLAGSEPVSHSTFLSKVGFDEYTADYTSATTVMQFADGLVAKTHVNSCSAYPQYNNLVVLGDKGSYIDGILFRDGKFRQEAGFFRPGQPNVGLNIVSLRMPKWLVSLSFNIYLRSISLVWRVWAAVMNVISNELMSHPDFGFRHYPMTVYNHDGACQTMVDNFVSAIDGHEAVLVGFDDAARVIRLCEAAEADGLRRRRTA